jgi:hypothetical protein
LLKGSYHPKAFLSITRNVKPGLIARTRVLRSLEKTGKSHTRTVVQKTGLTYASVLHHLHLLEAESILLRKGKRSYVWELTGAGQQRLASVENE